MGRDQVSEKKYKWRNVPSLLGLQRMLNVLNVMMKTDKQCEI
jgi:hypothetical protein